MPVFIWIESRMVSISRGEFSKYYDQMSDNKVSELDGECARTYNMYKSVAVLGKHVRFDVFVCIDNIFSMQKSQ